MSTRNIEDERMSGSVPAPGVWLVAAAILLQMPTEASAQPPPERRSLADLMEIHDGANRWIPGLVPLRVDEKKATAEGIRKLEGQRIVLFTDHAIDDEVRVLPAIFDQAFPLWCEYFRIDPAVHPRWRVTGCLMVDRDRFLRAGLLPPELPAFEHGYSRNYELWMYQQPSVYYSRHMLLHEGTHAFMNTILKSCGPPWYMEGIAELLATHRWENDRLVLNVVPRTKEDVPMWGRIRIIKEAFSERRAMHLDGVIAYDGAAHRNVEPYAWCWAAAMLMDHHPRYRDRFQALSRIVEHDDFSEQFFQTMREDWPNLSEEWQLLVANLEYGYDVERTAVDFAAGEPLPLDGRVVRIEADRGWQNTGLHLEAEQAYRLDAKGRYQVADQPKVWWCEPGGVSIRYYQGRPLGMLLAAVRPDPPTERLSPLLHPTTVGLGTALQPRQAGTLYLKINDSAGELHDNAGTIDINVRPAPFEPEPHRDVPPN